MSSGQDKNIKGYGRVMSRVYNRSHSNLKATSSVLSHVTSTNSGAKRPSVSSVRTGVFSDLPIVLNDYVPDTVSKKDLKQSTVVKPRRTLKSLVPGKKPLLRVERNIKYNETNSSLNVCASAPSVLGRNTESCPDSHVRHCLSSRSHSRLKELKDEIKSYQDTEQLLKLRSRLYKRCGVVLNDVGRVAEDKAVQAEDIDVKQDDFRTQRRADAGAAVSHEQMRSGPTVYPVDRYMVKSGNKMEMVNVTDDEIWIPTSAIKPEDEAMLDRLGDLLRAAAQDLALVSGQLVPRTPRPTVLPAPLDQQFNEKVHIEEIVNAKFHRYNIDEKPLPKKSQETGTRNMCIKPVPKTVNASVQVNRLSKPTKPCKKNLAISRTKIVQIDEHFSDNVKDVKLNNAKCSAGGPCVAYNEFTYTYEEPKVKNCNQKPLHVQEMPSINIRSELREQKVLQLDILPEQKVSPDNLETQTNVAVIALQHEPAPKVEKRITHYPQVVHTAPPPTKPAVRRVSKMLPCDTSDSTNNTSTDADRAVSQKAHKPSVRPPSRRISAIVDSKSKNNAKSKLTTKPPQNHRNIDEWKKKINTIYGLPSTSRNRKTYPNQKLRTSPKKTNPIRNEQILKSQLNNAEYIPYTKLTIGGIKVSDIEREISDIPDKDIPLSPILDKILTSRENSFHNNPTKEGNKHVLTTSDENLLEEVLDIERNVTKTLRKNVKEKVSPSKSNVSSETERSDKHMTYADDFEEERTEHELSLSEDEVKNIPADDKHETFNENVQTHVHNATYTKSTNLSLKNSVDIFEFVHSIDTQDHATQSNPVYKISLKATQTSPRNIQPIHNDLWPTENTREERDKKVNEELIKKLIMDECSDILKKNLAQPSTSENKEGKKNFAASQKNTQTSPAHVRSVMTSPTKTKTRTTSPLALALTVDRQTSPAAPAHREDLRIELDEINELALSINLSSPRFSLRLPRTSRDVLSNLDATPSKLESKPHNTTVKFLNKCSSLSSADGDYSSSDISSLGEIERKFKRKIKKNKIPTISESSGSSIVSKYSSDISSVILPLRSEGEVSAGRGDVRKSRFSRSDGEVSVGQTLH
ncbi:PREDICTED: uncharacterized protein LOC106121670 isoform X2 [Papilio xuthus]|uniref:Uncharacterized protein LOC106121670 isoform X2 n=1 Tax=Papilio xuthus TaxID=66420 RepID=A0AAJ6ZHX0_PAPXU|nr:PREDICTED: uncharacterized protein LOC106121670 isoform X2 [Papilio xuthus]